MEFRLNAPLTLSDGDYPVPLTFVCIVITNRDRALYVFNTRRGEWELPAGLIEPGESPYDTARRELFEETGQVVAQLRYLGLCLLRLSDGSFELGALYGGELNVSHPFMPNDETDRIMWWDGQTEVEDFVNALAPQLAALAGASG